MGIKIFENCDVLLPLDGNDLCTVFEDRYFMEMMRRIILIVGVRQEGISYEEGKNVVCSGMNDTFMVLGESGSTLEYIDTERAVELAQSGICCFYTLRDDPSATIRNKLICNIVEAKIDDNSEVAWKDATAAVEDGWRGKEIV